MALMKHICADLEIQYQELDNMVAELSDEQWHRETPFFHWSIFDQVAHIAFFDNEALLAIEKPVLFRKRVGGLMAAIEAGGRLPDYTNPLLGIEGPTQLMSVWRKTRSRLLDCLRMMAPQDRIIWYGPDMSARSFITARLMETWAHSQDVYDTLGIQRQTGSGLRHVAHLGVITFGWSFTVRGLQAPKSKPRIELEGPNGERWEWGDAEAPERLWGSAEEFCLVTTQRRNIADTALQWQGEGVGKWLSIAQAFAGVAQEPPAPGVRVVRHHK
jgi:uncharacterized protein (TIGR03084 family)